MVFDFKTKGNERSPESKEVQSLDKRKVMGGFTFYGHGGHLDHVTISCKIFLLNDLLTVFSIQNFT